jgi:RimJ/RimL family protein N-acetyltransferase
MSGFARYSPMRLAGRALSRIKHRLGFRTVRLFQSPARTTVPDADLAIGDPPNFELWRRAPDFPWPNRETIEKRYADGHQLWALRVGGQPVCFGWVGVVRELRLDEVGGRASLAAPLAWVWDCVTPRSQQGHGYFALFLIALRARLHPLAIGVEPDNHASLKSIERAGFELWASISMSPFGPSLHLVDQRYQPLSFRAAE